MTGLRIAIIGAGPSGVVALTKFLLEKRFSLVKAFERSSNVGGAWNYNPEHGPNRKKPRVVPSTDPTCRDERTRISDPDRTDHDPLWSWSTVMYAELNTNIPGPLMAFQDAPFPPGTDLFPNRETVLSYLVDYAENVREHIAFNREVISVRKEQSRDVWTVQSRSSCTTSASDMQTEQFDRILIATGHYETPKLPDIPGIRSFDAQFPDVIRHSKYYTTPDDYAGKSVLVVGGGPSATDITDQIARVTPRARLVRSKRSAIKQAMLLYDQTVEEVGEIKQMSADGTIEFNDGNTLRDVDRILFCTGYLYSFAFLDQSTLDLDRPLVTDGERLRSLYEHLFYIPDPTLAVLAMGMSEHARTPSRSDLLTRCRYCTLLYRGSASMLCVKGLGRQAPASKRESYARLGAALDCYEG